jgi:hypothetical protein
VLPLLLVVEVQVELVVVYLVVLEHQENLLEDFIIFQVVAVEEQTLLHVDLQVEQVV